MTTTYAKGTKVPITQTRGEIENLLVKHGADGFGYATKGNPSGHPVRDQRPPDPHDHSPTRPGKLQDNPGPGPPERTADAGRPRAGVPGKHGSPCCWPSRPS